MLEQNRRYCIAPVYRPFNRFGERLISKAKMHLQLQSCLIRSWSVADAAAAQRYANNRNIWLNLRDLFPHPYSLENAKAFLDHVTQEKPEMTFAVATSTEAIGCIGLRCGE